MMHADIINHLLNFCWRRNHDWYKLFIIALAIAAKVQLELERVERVFHFWGNELKLKLNKITFRTSKS